VKSRTTGFARTGLTIRDVSITIRQILLRVWDKLVYGATILESDCTHKCLKTWRDPASRFHIRDLKLKPEKTHLYEVVLFLYKLIEDSVTSHTGMFYTLFTFSPTLSFLVSDWQTDWLNAKFLLALANTVILGSESRGTHDNILPSDGSGSLQSRSTVVKNTELQRIF
jgi:hypothetical protein